MRHYHTHTKQSIAKYDKYLPLKQWKYLKSGRSEIQFQQGIDNAKIFPRCVLDRRHPGLSESWFIFCIWLFGMCVGMHQSLAKNTILPSSQVQGLLWTSLTSAIELTVSFLWSTRPKFSGIVEKTKLPLLVFCTV